jgi:ribonuclease HI
MVKKRDPLSPEARRVVDGLLAGRSLNELVDADDPVREEVERYLTGPREESAPRTSRKSRKPAPTIDLPAEGAVAYSDGASRGNPGPGAVGIHILAADGTELCAEGFKIGQVTNNVAEYRGAIAALEKAHALGVRVIELRMDSELVVKQIQGLYRVKDATLADLNRQLDALIRRFDSFRVRHVRREANQRTDELANEALDGG